MKYIASHPRLRAFPAALVPAILLVAIALATGCSSSANKGTSGDGGAPACDPSKCAPGNDCIDDGSGSGPTCHKVCTNQGQCPSGWYCNDGTPKSWCVQNTSMVPATGMGQWGASCLPTDGEGNNKACDSADGFICYGQTPTDASAYCTTQGCAQDSDCPASWWCETVNTKPNVTTPNRSFGKTRSVCVPRQYCAPCQADHDCPAASDGTQQHCVQDSMGNGLCTPQCGSNANCPLDAKCTTQWSVCTPAQGQSCQSDDDCPPVNNTFAHCNAGTCTPECGSDADCTGNNQKCKALATCIPRAGVCVGDGSFCSPCRNDGDCKDSGYCLSAAPYSTERFCSSAMNGATCPPDTSGMGFTLNNPPAGSCPKAPSGDKLAGVACSISSDNLAPSNQCIGLVTFGTASGMATDVPGCWTPNR